MLFTVRYTRELLILYRMVFVALKDGKLTIFPELVAIDKELHPVICDSRAACCTVTEIDRQRNVVSLRQVQVKRRCEESNPWTCQALTWTLRDPGRAWWLRQMETLPFCIHASFIQRSSSYVAILLAPKVAGHLPGYGILRTTSKAVVEYAARIFHPRVPDEKVLVKSHVVDYDREDVRLARLSIR